MLCDFEAIRSLYSRFPWCTRNTNFWHAILFTLNSSAICDTLVIDDFPSSLSRFLLLRQLLERFRQINSSSSSSSINNLFYYAIVVVIAVFLVYVRLQGGVNVHMRLLFLFFVYAFVCVCCCCFPRGSR